MIPQKIKIFFTILFIFSVHPVLQAVNLNISITNSFEAPISLSYYNSISPSKTSKVNLLPNKVKQLNLSINKNETIKISFKNNLQQLDQFNISYNDLKNHLKHYIPFSGPLADAGCSWNKTGIIKIDNIEGKIEKSWLPFIKTDMLNVSVEILNPQKSLNKNNDFPLSLTLFAVPSGPASLINLNNSSSSNIPLNEESFELSSHNVILKTKLEPVVYKENKLISRWIDVILHNFTENSYLLYALRKKPGYERIRFLYKNNNSDSDIVFYPPQTQLKGPGYKFSAEKLNDSEFIPHPSLKELHKGDKYYLVIGSPDSKSVDSLNCAVIEISAYASLGRTFKGGINLSSNDDQAYKINFTPFNCSFGLKKAVFSNISNYIRIPVNKNGEKCFKLQAFKNIKIRLVPQNTKSGVIQTGKNAVTYVISGTSRSDNKTHKYKIFIIAPPFLNGNSPGIYSPINNIPSNYDIGNYIRYPLHIYILPFNESSKNNLTKLQSKTQLPKDLIGEVDYFISDNITTDN